MPRENEVLAWVREMRAISDARYGVLVYPPRRGQLRAVLRRTLARLQNERRAALREAS